jgi:hypothetical protein
MLSTTFGNEPIWNSIIEVTTWARLRPCAPMQDSAEQVRLHDEPVKAAHVGRRIDAAKIDGGHGASLAIA